MFYFYSDKYRINLNVPMKSIEQKDIKDFHKKIDQDRIMAIQVCEEFLIYFCVILFK